MEVIVCNLNPAAGIKNLNKRFSTQTYITGCSIVSIEDCGGAVEGSAPAANVEDVSPAAVDTKALSYESDNLELFADEMEKEKKTAEKCAAAIQILRKEKKSNIMIDDKSARMKTHKRNSVVPYLEEDIIFILFTTLSAHEVHRLSYSCKLWYKLINNNRFVVAHLRQSNPGLIAIPCETKFLSPNIIRIKNGKVDVRKFRIESKKIVIDTCNGLVLLKDMPKVGDLSVSNPITGQLFTLPPSTQRRKYCCKAVGFTFVESTGEYRVVSVIDESGSFGCEMFTVGSGRWKWVSAPFVCLRISWPSFSRGFISMKGVLHFIIGIFVEDSGKSLHMVSFDAVEEKFYKSNLPPSCCKGYRLHEIEDCPSFVVPPNDWSKEGSSCWDIWVLKDMHRGEWDKRYSLNVVFCHNKISRYLYSHVLGMLANGRFLIFQTSYESEFQYHVYDVQRQKWKSLELNLPFGGYYFLPHVESLVFW